MMGQARKLQFCRVLLILNLCFIWGNSLLPAEISQSLSDNTRDFLLGLSDPEFFGMLVRKAAHFLEFAALGLLLCWQMQLVGKVTGYAVIWGLLAACIDEGIQLFVPGRAARATDVLIDFCGILTGILLLKIGQRIVRRKQPTYYGGK